MEEATKPTKPKNHYIDNEKFLIAVSEYRVKVHTALAAEAPRPRVPEYIGECLFMIATHLARKPNFTDYPFRDDMISDGVENSLRYIDNFDPAKSSNPFSYFTSIIYYAFLRRILKEKTNLYVKYKMMGNEVVRVLIESGGEEHVVAQLNDMVHDSYSQEFIGDFIRTFEENLRIKREKVKKPKKKKEKGTLKFKA
jgi:hypothetical protein